MANTDPNTEEIEAQRIKQAKKELAYIQKCAESINVASYVVEKILMRVAAVKLIDEIEERCEVHGVDLTLSSLSTIINSTIWPRDPAEADGVFDTREKDRDYLSIQNSSLCMSDSEDADNQKYNSDIEIQINIHGAEISSIPKSYNPQKHLLDEAGSSEYNQNQDWRIDEEPQAPKHDSFLSRQVPVKEVIHVDMSRIKHKETFGPKGLTPRHPKSIKRPMSGKSSASFLRKSIEKANAHFTQRGTVKQKRLTDLPPEEEDDPNVERMRLMKQRDAARREKDHKEKQEIQRRNEERAKQDKQNQDKLSKKNYTFDYNGSILFVRKPVPEHLPTDFNVPKVSKRSINAAKAVPSKSKEEIDAIVQKHFAKRQEAMAKESEKKAAKIEGKAKNYKGMENKTTPGGSNFDDITVSGGVTLMEKGKTKVGKQNKNRLSNSMTRTEYLLNASKSFSVNQTHDFTLPNLRDNKMDETIDLNSTIKSNENESKTKKLSESHHILPPIDNSRLGLSGFRNSSFAKTTTYDKINISAKASARDFISSSLIIKNPITDRKMKGSKSMGTLISMLPDKRSPLSQYNPIEAKVDTGIGTKSSLQKSFIPEQVYTDKNTITKRFDDFNRQLLFNSEISSAKTGLNPLLKVGKKPKVNRSKNFIEKSNPVLLNQELRGNKKAYIDRILEIKQERMNERYTEL